jgi:cytochrome P450
LPPHPRDLPVLGSMPRFARDILQTVLDGWRECGDVVRFRGLRTMTLVAHPDQVKRVLADRQEIYPRSDVVKTYLRPIMGDGLFTSAGDQWKRRRRTLEPVFRGPDTTRLAPAITERATALLDRWSGRASGEPFDVAAEMSALGVDVMEHLLFGPGGSGGPAFAEALVDAIEYASPRVMAPVNPPGFLPSGRRYRRSLQTLDSIVLEAIADRRREGRYDLLSDMVRARDPETGESLSEREIRDDALTAAFGGYKGLPGGLTWTWYRLSEHPEVRERVEAEVDEVLAGRPAEGGDLARLPYMTSVILEVLRLHPPLWIWSRPPTAEDEIDGFRIPAGMFVLNIPYVTHRHPEFWDDPEAFRPERFGAGGHGAAHEYAYFPFGGGPRKCVGDELGLLALQLTVATVVGRYQLELEPGYTPKRDLEFMLRPANGMPMRLAVRP